MEAYTHDDIVRALAAADAEKTAEPELFAVPEDDYFSEDYSHDFAEKE